jgi:hypothetical protein
VLQFFHRPTIVPWFFHALQGFYSMSEFSSYSKRIDDFDNISNTFSKLRWRSIILSLYRVSQFVYKSNFDQSHHSSYITEDMNQILRHQSVFDIKYQHLSFNCYRHYNFKQHLCHQVLIWGGEIRMCATKHLIQGYTDSILLILSSSWLTI